MRIDWVCLQGYIAEDSVYYYSRKFRHNTASFFGYILPLFVPSIIGKIMFFFLLQAALYSHYCNCNCHNKCYLI